MLRRLPFRQMWAEDFEFSAPPGEKTHRPVCMVSRELRSGQTIRLWEDEFGLEPPFPIGPDILHVAYGAAAEMSCYLSLGWKFPHCILDLYPEAIWMTNGRREGIGRGFGNTPKLISVLAAYGLDAISAEEKDYFRNLAIRGGPYTAEEKAGLLDYCETDVKALEELLPRMLPKIDLPRALIRGRYMTAVAAMERNGIPLDIDLLRRLNVSWKLIEKRLIEEVDKQFWVYEGRSFREKAFDDLLRREGVPWPRLASGRLSLSGETFRSMVKAYPRFSPLYELRHNLGKMRLSDLRVGQDGRNRAWLKPFGSRTGRNQPGNSQFIFGPSVWLRGLIKPEPGYAIAYIDWEQQEFGIGAALSGDKVMMEAYRSGDPYLEFAKMAGDIPPDGTKKTHEDIRNLYKQCVLATQYGQGPHGLSGRIGKTESVSRRLLDFFAETFAVFWKWSEANQDYGMLHGKLQTVLGWRCFFLEDPKPKSEERGPNPRTIANFLMQGNGAEMLRLACCEGIEAGIEIIAPIHDAVLIRSPLSEIKQDVERMRAIMARASRIVLGGFELRTEVELFEYPHRFMDEKRGLEMWNLIMRLLEEEEEEEEKKKVEEQKLDGGVAETERRVAETDHQAFSVESLSLATLSISESTDAYS